MTTLLAIRRLERRVAKLNDAPEKIIAIVRYCPDCMPKRYFVNGEIWDEAELELKLSEQRNIGAPSGHVLFMPLKIGECDICVFNNFPEFAPSALD